MLKVKFNDFLIYSQNQEKYFYTKFSDGVNIIRGKNTSGKSTLIQSIIYCLGINDVKENLSEIIDLNVIFRLNIQISKNSKINNVSIIRDNETLVVIEDNGRKLVFDGISGDSSNEHVKLKKYISNLFDFSLVLESKNLLKEAPIETIFLPYYISQSVGWVYLRESFSNLNFYRNFKQDYLDYYLGITTDIDRIELQDLRKRKAQLDSEIKFLSEMETNNEDLQLAKLVDERFKEEATAYLQGYTKLRNSLIEEEKKHINLCSQKSLAKNRIAILFKINKNISKQRPDIDQCPICEQTLPSSLEKIYAHGQDVNDTKHELFLAKDHFKDFQSKINSSLKKIKKYNIEIEKDYSLIQRYLSSNVTFSSWLNHKSNVKLVKNINESIGTKTIELGKVKNKLSELSNDDSVNKIRYSKERTFLDIFTKNLLKLRVKKLSQPRYKDLYKINSFPYQGVELHKTVMAYHFSLNELISSTANIHRLPFILDAVLKEDIDPESREVIFKFIGTSCPSDTQVLLSLSEYYDLSQSVDEITHSVESVNKIFFDGKANLIQVGDGNSERSLLIKHDGAYKDYINETLEIVY